MFCQKCGHKLENDALFCPMCGTKVSEQSKKEEVNIANEQINQTSNVANDVSEENADLKKIEPKMIKAATEEEKRQNAEEVKGMFFKKVEVSKELLNELSEAKQASGTEVQSEIAEDKSNNKGKKESILKKVIGNVSDKDLDKPAWRTKAFIFGVIILIILFVVSLGTIFAVGQKAKGDYHEDLIIYDVYDAVDISENKQNGWEGDHYYKDGAMVRNDWVEDNGEYYYCGSDGQRIRADWIQEGNNWYYFYESGIMVKDTLHNINGSVYYFGSDGRMYANEYTPDLKHFAGPEGILVY